MKTTPLGNQARINGEATLKAAKHQLLDNFQTLRNADPADPVVAGELSAIEAYVDAHTTMLENIEALQNTARQIKTDIVQLQNEEMDVFKASLATDPQRQETIKQKKDAIVAKNTELAALGLDPEDVTYKAENAEIQAANAAHAQKLAVVKQARDNALQMFNQYTGLLEQLKNLYVVDGKGDTSLEVAAVNKSITLASTAWDDVNVADADIWIMDRKLESLKRDIDKDINNFKIQKTKDFVDFVSNSLKSLEEKEEARREKILTYTLGSPVTDFEEDLSPSGRVCGTQ